ncbi:NUDIX domain-containing protein [Sphingosinicella sp. YJ22]|uniref:NUDIX hydrolase n=1 Tax=Sphingosinicella sp. YJ22 TaxID=1104780 RepID=UPI0014077EBF|nr:NUDIX domain-containing protein [Sphingosinicella sp. YJ22]
MDELPPPVPAATLVLMRDVAHGPPELLMMERPGHMAFAAGALVFPGGRIDAQDHAAAERLGGDAARIAAVRETIEETGIVPVSGLVSGQVETLRTGLFAGRDFADLLAEAGTALDLAGLVPFARWCPNFRETRRFDATFFLAAAPDGVGEPSPQPGEVTRAFWASAKDVLAELESDRAHAIFPTRRNLERLARYGSFAEARADAERREVRMITPWVEQRDGVPWVCIPDDLGYPVTAELLETARRR